MAKTRTKPRTKPPEKTAGTARLQKCAGCPVLFVKAGKPLFGGYHSAECQARKKR